MTAFIPIVPAGTFCVLSSNVTNSDPTTRRTSTPRMAVDPDGPAYSKYMSLIPPDRLNKAPIIAINAYDNPDFNSVSVRMADLQADEPAGNSLRAGITIVDEPGPPVEKYSKYYDPATLHEAPHISLYGSDGLPFQKHSLCILQTTVAPNFSEAKNLLGDVPPNPSLYEYRYRGRLNKAPCVQICLGDSESENNVNLEINEQPLALYAAAELLAKYRS